MSNLFHRKKHIKNYKIDFSQYWDDINTPQNKSMNSFRVVRDSISSKHNVKPYINKVYRNWKIDHLDNYEIIIQSDEYVSVHDEYWSEDLESQYQSIRRILSEYLSEDKISKEVIHFLHNDPEWIRKLEQYIPALKGLAETHNAIDYGLEIWNSYEGEQEEIHFKIIVSDNVEPIELEEGIVNKFIEKFPNENFDYFSIGVWREQK